MIEALFQGAFFSAYLIQMGMTGINYTLLVPEKYMERMTYIR